MEQTKLYFLNVLLAWGVFQLFLPVVSPARMGLFGINRELQFGVCNHGEPCASPQQKLRGKLFFTGEEEFGRPAVNKSPRLFIGRAAARREEGAVLSLQGMGAPPSDLPTLIEVSVYYYYCFLHFPFLIKIVLGKHH